MCATFGSGVGYACVVDVGDQKTSVCCVEDGLSQKSTQLTMEFGGCDISQCFHWLLTRISFPYKDCDLGRRMDALFIQDLKETFCHLEQVSIQLSGISHLTIHFYLWNRSAFNSGIISPYLPLWTGQHSTLWHFTISPFLPLDSGTGCHSTTHTLFYDHTPLKSLWCRAPDKPGPTNRPLWGIDGCLLKVPLHLFWYLFIRQDQMSSQQLSSPLGT